MFLLLTICKLLSLTQWFYMDCICTVTGPVSSALAVTLQWFVCPFGALTSALPPRACSQANDMKPIKACREEDVTFPRDRSFSSVAQFDSADFLPPINMINMKVVIPDPSRRMTGNFNSSREVSACKSDCLNTCFVQISLLRSLANFLPLSASLVCYMTETTPADLSGILRFHDRCELKVLCTIIYSLFP
ncbi:uncharacterized protein LOC112531487 isoform X2 [Gallus gallus]|uniref:uncharacterized protein LOC112531487 isoform X2 n=1 Tax=Gallus gallus TaxID=9031 RepID=UPI001F02FD6E|nr:uncharacterized protein LOC112531487 isoform X2 [Gallus gallus]